MIGAGGSDKAKGGGGGGGGGAVLSSKSIIASPIASSLKGEKGMSGRPPSLRLPASVGEEGRAPSRGDTNVLAISHEEKSLKKSHTAPVAELKSSISSSSSSNKRDASLENGGCGDSPPRGRLSSLSRSSNNITNLNRQVSSSKSGLSKSSNAILPPTSGTARGGNIGSLDSGSSSGNRSNINSLYVNTSNLSRPSTGIHAPPNTNAAAAGGGGGGFNSRLSTPNLNTGNPFASSGNLMGRSESERDLLGSRLSRTGSRGGLSRSGYPRRTNYDDILVEPWCLHFIFDQEKLLFPKKVLYNDFFGKKPCEVLDISNWKVCPSVFALIKATCRTATEFKADHTNVKGQLLSFDHLQAIRGFPNLRSVSLNGSINVTDDVAKCLGSLRELKELDLSGNQLCDVALSIMSQSCSSLRTLKLRQCTNLTDIGMTYIASHIVRFRKLCDLDFSGCKSFTDEGSLQVMTAAPLTLSSVSFSSCPQVTSLTMTACRQKLTALTHLNVAKTFLGQSCFEWLSEGCRFLEHIDLTNCFELDSIGLQMMGRKCTKLKYVKLDNCCKFFDKDVETFFTELTLNGSSLEVFSINGCINCGDKALVSAAESSCHSLREIYLNGLSHISSHSLGVFFKKCTKLTIFEMSLNGETKVAITHRQSVLPHISNDALAHIGCTYLSKFNIAGSALITDDGIASLVQRCSKIKYLDISYCNQLTDMSLEYISQHLRQLETLIISGNIHITDEGFKVLAANLTSLHNLEFNGCAKTTDEGVMSLTQLPGLKSVHFRNCSNITNEPLFHLANSCPNLRSLDISSLDLITLDVVRNFFVRCSFLTSFNCEGCAFTAKDFASAVKDTLPLAEWAVPNCKLQPRHPNIVSFNKYVIKMQEYNRKVGPIQKLIKVICFRNWMNRAQRLKNKAARCIERVYKNFKSKIRRKQREKMKHIRRFCSLIIQRWARRRISIIFARRKLSKLRQQDKARRDIQRVFRGHMGRKRNKRMFLRLYAWYTKIGRIVHKYWVVMAARKLHRQICIAQAVVRMFIRRRRFLKAKKGVCMLEMVVLDRIRRNTEVRFCLNGVIDRIILRDRMVSKIQRNMKACLFNKGMSPFILISCIYYRTEFDKNTWNQLIISRYWRGFIIRLKNWRRHMRPTWEYNAATKIQTQVRGRIARKVRRNLILKEGKVLFRWKRFVIKRPQLRVNVYLKIIQRSYHKHFVWKNINRYVRNIQRNYRGWKARKRVKKMKLERVNMASGIIARKYRRYKAYWWRQERRSLEWMKSWKIGRWVKRKMNMDALRRIQAAKAANRRKKEFEEKKSFQASKRMKYVVKLRNMFHNRYAARIQRVYRKWYKEKTKKRMAMANRKKALEEAKEEIMEMRLERAAFDFSLNPLQLYRNFSWFLTNTFAAHGLNFEPKDKVKLSTAILTQQSKTLLQEGIIDIHMTWGLIEKKNFFSEQELNRKASKPHFERIDGDISGKVGLNVHIWVMRGEGKECICRLEVEPKPPTSLTATRARVADSLGRGIKIAWHPDVHIEFRGHCTIKQNLGGYAVEDIKVVFTPEEGEMLKEQKYLRVKNLIPLGFFSTIWSLAKIPDDDPDLFKQPTLNVRPWANKRLLRVVKSFNLLESEVLQLRQAYEKILGVRIAESITIAEMAQAFGLQYTQMFKWVAKAVEPEKGSELSFAEYVHMVSYFSMFTRGELIKFLFGQMDPQQLGYVFKEGWDKFCDILAEEGPYNPSPWKKQFINFYDKKLKMLFCAQFDKFSAQFPQSLWVAQEMQKKIKTFNLGEMFWEKKMNQYRIVREEQGVRLIK